MAVAAWIARIRRYDSLRTGDFRTGGGAIAGVDQAESDRAGQQRDRFRNVSPALPRSLRPTSRLTGLSWPPLTEVTELALAAGAARRAPPRLNRLACLARPLGKDVACDLGDVGFLAGEATSVAFRFECASGRFFDAHCDAMNQRYILESGLVVSADIRGDGDDHATIASSLTALIAARTLRSFGL
jgi:hypothetical protein